MPEVFQGRVLGALILGGFMLFCVANIFIFNAPPALDPPTVARPPTLEPLRAPPLTPQSDDNVTYASPGDPFALDMPAEWRVFPLHEHDMDIAGVVLRNPDGTSEITVLADPEPADRDDSRSARREYAHAVVENYFAPYGVDNISGASFTDTRRKEGLREYYPYALS